MSDGVDYEALRAQRNQRSDEALRRITDELCVPMQSLFTTQRRDDCYCDCERGGPCEHTFGGWVEFQDGSGGSQVCTRCSMTAMSHSLRTAP